MVPLNSPELERLSQFLEKYDRKSAVAQLAGLLTVPAFQANTLRIETLVHLAVAHCQGQRKPGLKEIDHWLNRHLGKTSLARWEDPVEDVFVSNIETPEGNRCVLEGIWQSNDYYAQVVIDVLSASNAPAECRALLGPVLALLRLSDDVIGRLGLRRWKTAPSSPGGNIRVAPGLRLHDRERAVSFTHEDLAELEIDPALLVPFVLKEEDRRSLINETIGHTSLEARPLIDFGGELVLALPHTVSPAIRRFVLRELLRNGYLFPFADVLAARQASQLEQDALAEFRGESVSLELPPHKGQVPPLHGWLLKYDVGHYLHVLLFQDNLQEAESEGLSGSLKFPAAVEGALDTYLKQVADYCASLPDFICGFTLLAMGGVGRGFSFAVSELPAEWGVSFVPMPDLLMLAGELERPITRFLKCVKQKEWAEKQSVAFLNYSGDYNLYCFWRRMDYQLIPRDLPISKGSTLVVPTDMVAVGRERTRRLSDHHVLPRIEGGFSPVMRFGREAYFASMQDRPIYVSLGHLRDRVLAGVVETLRGASWLVVVSREGDERIRHLLYELWSGFISLFDRLVAEVETVLPELSSGPIAIELDFSEVVLSDDQDDMPPQVAVVEPTVKFDHERRSANVRFSRDFLGWFQQPDDSGERNVLTGVAKGLLGLHRPGGGADDGRLVETLIRQVLINPGMRVLHLFRTYYPIDYLVWSQTPKASFLAHEDFVFNKLRLSEGCVPEGAGEQLSGKDEANEYLKNVVAKLWQRIRSELQQYDRASLIKGILSVYEAAIQDRDHWNRTAQAVLAIYSAADDVHDVAQRRESKRTQVSLAARTILEMGVCECPISGGRDLSKSAGDELLALAALLVEVATDSDAINSELIAPRVDLHPNGEYTVNRDFHDLVIKPFQTEHFREEYEEAASRYERLYLKEQPSGRTRAEDVFSSDFIGAFNSEFGLSPDEAIDGFAELMDMAVEQGSVVVETTLRTAKDRIIENRRLSPAVTDAFIRTFGTFHRPAWDKPPKGYTNRDLSPWRFRRRLSVTAKPLLVFGDKDDDSLFFGVGALRLGFHYVLDRSERGHLPQEFFASREMKRYIGKVNDERGHTFAHSIADRLREAGWEARNEVQLTELGGSDELGDVDVLAWKPTGEVLLIECKRLQLARTVAEVAEICRRFRGEAKDELDKHVRRVKWIRENPSGLGRVVGFAVDTRKVDDRLVTNIRVPMMYLETLPIDPRKIGPLVEHA